MLYRKGDIVVNRYSDPVGHEPAYSRPALVVSEDFFNMSTSMALLCPITSSDHAFPLHIELPEGLSVHGRVVTEQIRAYDLEFRQPEVVDHLDADSGTMAAITECIRSFF
ncbi:type II toxin-antitoxin system PemK/MazF family toxin [Candidatus Collinsella stercoripullorum]|uniref:type II toxin-antitoxin system PemK/MazF family toxin n=1 Tax=Candidatus Collinsella stercoripullorum TaxID=2838522 RepID=UPI0022DF7983|nr:type II toxin-antitoxin system PemK/MazF family toxin [Candidatus Collinsella stercoripullorum]